MSTAQGQDTDDVEGRFPRFPFSRRNPSDIGAVGCRKFWAHTRFWLPRYIYVLAAIGLIVGVLTVWASPADSPIKRCSTICGSYSQCIQSQSPWRSQPASTSQ
jgi:hypothetical protein